MAQVVWDEGFHACKDEGFHACKDEGFHACKDEGFHACKASRVGDPDAAEESVAWVNYLIDGLWGGRAGLHPRTSGVGVARGTAAIDGLGSFLSE